MPRKYRELTLQREIWEYLTAKGVFCWIDFQPMTPGWNQRHRHKSSVGVSDIVGVYKGKPLAIEVKVKAKKGTPKQEEFLERMRIEGGLGFIARNLDEVDEGMGWT